MRPSRAVTLLALLALPLALVAAGCGGGGGSVSKADVAVVGGEHIARTELDRLMTQAKKSYELQKRDFPKAGSPEYQALQNQALQSLVQRAELAGKAKELGIAITPKQVEDRLTQIKKQYFNGDDKKYKAELKRQGVTEESVSSDIESQLVSEAIYNKVTADAKVTDKETKVYYDKNPTQYTQPETREVRQILVKSKATADSLYAQLKAGADFASLAKKFSQDPGSKAQGGKLVISRGQTVPEFDKAAFSLKTAELSKPVKTQFGWHVIRAEKAVTPSKKTPYAQVKEAIRQQILQQERNSLITKWFDDVKKEFASKTKYATGFGPVESSGTTTTG